MTLPATQHPSYLALDRAALGGPSSELQKHVEDCPECRAYLEALAEPPAPSGLAEVRRRVAARRSKARFWWAAVPVAAAAGALLFVDARVETPREAPYVGVKGFSSVWIYVKREGDTQLWDGKRALQPGDQLRLKVDPGAFRHVAVYAAKEAAPPEPLYAGEVAAGRISTLPDAWELDAEPGAEQLFVVLSHEPVTPRWAEWRDGKVAPGTAVLPFVLPKTIVVDADADASDGSP